MVRSLSLLAASLLVIVSAFAQVGPERQVSPPILGKAPDSQYLSAVASNGEGYLLAFSGLLERIDGEGRILDPGGFPPHDLLPAEITAVASDGEDYVVAWLHEANLYTTRVGQDGSRGEPQLVAQNAKRAHLAWNGHKYLIVWSRVNEEVLVRFLDRTGRALSAPQRICRCDSFSDVELASNGGEFLVAFTVGIPAQNGSVEEALYTVTIDNDGRVNQPRPIPVSASVRAIFDLAANGDSYSLLLLEQDFGGESSEELLLIDALGFTPREGVRFPREHPAFNFALLPNPAGVLLVGGTAEEIVAQRIDQRGDVLDEHPIMIAEVPEAYRSRLIAGAWDRGQYLIAWSQRDSLIGDASLLGVIVEDTLSGLPRDASPLHAGAAKQTGAVAASRSNLDVIAWIETRETYGPSEVRGARITRDSVPLDGPGFHVDTDHGPHNQLAIAWDPQRFLVVWTSSPSRDAPRILGRFFFWDNPAMSSEAFDISDLGGSNPSVVWNGREYLVLWQREEGYPTYAEKGVIYGRRVSADGTVLDSQDVLLGDTVTGQTEPSIAWNGSAYLLTYSRGLICRRLGCGFSDQLDLYGTLFDAELRFLARDFVISATFSDEIASSVSTDGRRFLVAWATSGISFEPEGIKTHADIFAMHLDEGGRLLWDQPRVITNATNTELSPNVNWNGTSYVVTWTEVTVDATNRSDTDIKAVQLSREGAPLLPEVLKVSATRWPEHAGAVIGTGGHSRIIYSRSAPELRQGAALRLFWRDLLNFRNRSARSH